MPISTSHHGGLFRDLNAIAKNVKNGDFKQDRTFGRVAKSPIANTSDELAEIDFVEYGDFATSPLIQDAFHVSR